MTDARPYRPAVGIMLIDAAGRVFVGQRIDTTLEAWQMPQGGIDRGEDAHAAALRELEEETGIAPRLVETIAQAPGHFDYDLPVDLAARMWKGRYRGQRQIWFLMGFTGTDADIDLQTAHPEFRAFRWVAPEELEGLIVPFKRALYAAIVAALAPLIPRA